MLKKSVFYYSSKYNYDRIYLYLVLSFKIIGITLLKYNFHTIGFIFFNIPFIFCEFTSYSKIAIIQC
jgi:hypothetical protein